MSLVKVVCPESWVKRFSCIPGAFGGARKLGVGIRTSMVSVLPLRAASGLFPRLCVLLGVLVDGVRDTRLGVCPGVIYGSRLPALMAGGGGAGFGGRPTGAGVPQPEKVSFGVRSHMLLILGVSPPPPAALVPMFVWFFCIMFVVELGDRRVECEACLMKSVRAAYSGS